MTSVLLMCFGSLLIAITPTYAAIGIAAPILLGFARIVQGLSLGGEYGASATYLSEVAGEKHRGFYSSFQYVDADRRAAVRDTRVAAAAAGVPDAGAVEGMGLADSVSRRCGARADGARDAPQSARDR